MNSPKTIGRVIGLLVLGMLSAAPLSAATISVHSGGITDFTASTSPTGTSGDPWTINETMTSAGILVFDDFPDGNPTGTGHEAGRWIKKTVLNNTLATWYSFELELQIEPGEYSVDGDGLSFAQGGSLVFSSDQFGTVTAIENTRDYLNFHNGSVDPGEYVTFRFAITDNYGNDPFYLQQTPDKREIGDDEQVPEPSLVVLTGLAGLGLVRRRVRK
jgi:hypothetical protein